MENISITLNIVFIIIAIITVIQFYRATNHSKLFLTIISIWATIQLIIGLTDFYVDGFSTFPPKLTLLIGPPFAFIVFLLSSKKGNQFINNLNLKNLALIHTIRIPVEVCLYYLFIAKAIPVSMTFEGLNFDIFAGLTAPFVYYFGFIKNILSKNSIILWNIVSIILLLTIVTIAILSVESSFQQFGLKQPNKAIAHFPFNWLPSIIVPIVLFSHLATIKKLIQKNEKH